MPGTKRSTQVLRQSRWHIDERSVGSRIYLLHRRREYEINSTLPTEFEVRFQCLWVAGVVLIRAELKRVYENADGNETALSPGGLKELFMAGVKRAQGRHQANHFG